MAGNTKANWREMSPSQRRRDTDTFLNVLDGQDEKAEKKRGTVHPFEGDPGQHLLEELADSTRYTSRLIAQRDEALELLVEAMNAVANSEDSVQYDRGLSSDPPINMSKEFEWWDRAAEATKDVKP